MTPRLPITYFGSVEYYWHLSQHSKVEVDLYETYQKQTYRNRCVILGANGPLNLSVPVIRPFGKLTKTNDILISNAENWRQVHWKSLESSYNRTPYFEFYADTLKAILFSGHEFLYQLNLVLIHHLIDKIGLTTQLELSIENASKNSSDLLENFDPKKDTNFKCYPYQQTFSDRYGFTNNLSILDLLFNEGPNTICILNESKYENGSTGFSHPKK